jgi:serine/threonine protein kinase
MSLLSGTRLGPYEVMTPLGAGGMGEVYKARDTRLERIVAIKVLPDAAGALPEIRQRFEREARASPPSTTRTSAASSISACRTASTTW